MDAAVRATVILTAVFVAATFAVYIAIFLGDTAVFRIYSDVFRIPLIFFALVPPPTTASIKPPFVASSPSISELIRYAVPLILTGVVEVFDHLIAAAVSYGNDVSLQVLDVVISCAVQFEADQAAASVIIEPQRIASACLSGDISPVKKERCCRSVNTLGDADAVCVVAVRYV